MYFISLINKIIKWTIIRLIAFKIEIYNFLIHEIKYLLIKDKKLIMCIYINNALKYKIIEKKLRDINVYIKISIKLYYMSVLNKITKWEGNMYIKRKHLYKNKYLYQVTLSSIE